jgi:hypothetical protein
MVFSITKLVLIGGGLAIAAGLAYFTYQYMSSDTLGGQLARSRIGLDKPPLTGQEPIKGIIEDAWKNVTGEPLDLPIPTRRANAALYIEEERYEHPWALRR